MPIAIEMSAKLVQNCVANRRIGDPPSVTIAHSQHLHCAAVLGGLCWIVGKRQNLESLASSRSREEQNVVAGLGHTQEKSLAEQVRNQLGDCFVANDVRVHLDAEFF